VGKDEGVVAVNIMHELLGASELW